MDILKGAAIAALVFAFGASPAMDWIGASLANVIALVRPFF